MNISVELFPPVLPGWASGANVVVEGVQIAGRSVDLMYQPDEDGDVHLASRHEGYQRTPDDAPYGWEDLVDWLGLDAASDLDLTAVREAAQEAYESAVRSNATPEK